MTVRLGVVMDPIDHIKPHKDTTVGLLREAAHRAYQLFYFEPGDLTLRGGGVHGAGRALTIHAEDTRWCTLAPPQRMSLASLDVILMRKDPPFDMEYIYTTYLLEQAAAQGTLVVNNPQGLRDANEKLFAAWFPEVTPPTLVTRRYPELRDFLAEHRDIIVKPLDGMGGTSVFRVRADDPNVNVIFETMTGHETRFTMAQRYLPAIAAGDKRILVIDGKAVPYALARIPAPGESRGNLAAGGRGEGRALTAADRAITERVGPTLRARGLLFVGLDVIGEYLTEINVTSPTGLRELDAAFGLTIAARLFDAIEARLMARSP